MEVLNASIKSHSESPISADRITAAQQEKDCFWANKNSIMARIDSLHDTKRNLVIHLASEGTMNNAVLSDTLANEVLSINQEI